MASAQFTAEELRIATGGSWLNGQAPTGKWQINTDSRTIRAGECFIPIVGERFDGHDFLKSLPDGVTALAEYGRSCPETGSGSRPV